MAGSVESDPRGGDAEGAPRSRPQLRCPREAPHQAGGANHCLEGAIRAESLAGTRKSAVDALQLRGLDVSRFEKRIGRLSADLMEEVALAVGLVVEVP